MILSVEDVERRTGIERRRLEIWVEVGWIRPAAGEAGPAFGERDLARAHLIRDLIEEMGINEEGVPVVLDLLDQVHGLRRALHGVTAAVSAQSAPVREEILARALALSDL